MGGMGLHGETRGGMVRRNVEEEEEGKTDLEFLESLALVPAALPLFFHPLYGD